MYSVMIVDKRKQMYTIYRDMIPWQQYQFEIISYCDSESQAMEHFCEHRHDLVITDIRLRSGGWDLTAETAEGVQPGLSCDRLFQ